MIQFEEIACRAVVQPDPARERWKTSAASRASRLRTRPRQYCDPPGASRSGPQLGR